MREPSVKFVQAPEFSRYLQSLDSVRFKESDANACIINAKVETFLSLLFGQTIVLGEHQFLDSTGFLAACFELHQSFNNLDRKNQARLKGIFPFKLGFRNYWKSVDDLIAKKLGDSSFKLSRWEGIGNHEDPEMVRIRKKIEIKYRKGEFLFERDKLLPPQDRMAAEELRIARDYFIAGEQDEVRSLFGSSIVYKVSGLPILPNYLTLIADSNKEGLESQLAIDQQVRKLGVRVDQIIPDRLMGPTIDLIDGLNELRNTGISFENRSNVRMAPEAQEVISNDAIYNGLLELYDSFYNTNIATSIAADSAIATSARNFHESDYIKAAYALSAYAKLISSGLTPEADRIHDDENKEFLHPIWSQGVQFDLIRGTKEEETLAQIPWDVVWNAFLNSDWVTSVTKLNNALKNWDRLIIEPTRTDEKLNSIIQELRDSISHHTALVASLIADPAWEITTQSKAGTVLVNWVPKIAGKAGKLIVQLSLSSLTTGRPFEFEFDFVGESTELIVEGGIKTAIQPLGKWWTKGHYHKVFQQTYREFP